jgi:hypothetical protein
MKAAILISGIVRDYSNMENITKNIINTNPEYEFDFFLSFYDVNCRNTIKFFRENDLSMLENINIPDILNTYKPKSYTIINFVELHKSLKSKINSFKMNNLYYNKHFWDRDNSKNAYNALGQMYSVEKVKDVFHEYSSVNNINYDLVIRYRYDLFTNEPIYFNKYDLNHIYGINRLHCFPDWIFFGNSLHMKPFLNVYSNLMDNKIKPNDPEGMFKQNANNICNILYTINDTFELIRPTFM